MVAWQHVLRTALAATWKWVGLSLLPERPVSPTIILTTFPLGFSGPGSDSATGLLFRGSKDGQDAIASSSFSPQSFPTLSPSTSAWILRLIWLLTPSLLHFLTFSTTDFGFLCKKTMNFCVILFCLQFICLNVWRRCSQRSYFLKLMHMHHR